ncbi:MAG: family 1 glycosylhydrolase [Planctomycetes bacterium]|nr:family 1 glycosylhydrolase [Planctomycetota bacterium]
MKTRNRPALIALRRGAGFFVLVLVSSPACSPNSLNSTGYVLPHAANRPVNPPPFWWGISTSSYQIEESAADGGRTFATDWDLFKQTAGGVARDDRVASFKNTERDLTALKNLGVTHYRFSIEWARVEPSPGVFDNDAIEHYAALARRLREEGIEPVLCLWHFTFPDWLCDFDHLSRHGWLHPQASIAWGEYVTTMCARLAPYVQIFAPQNEPNAYALGMLVGHFPPGRPSGEALYDELNQAEVQAFLQAASIIRACRSDATIISVQNIVHWRRDSFDLIGFYEKSLEYNYRHLDGIAGAIDYVGFNYYSGEIASPLSLYQMENRAGPGVTDMGWYIDPEGLEIEIVELSRRYRLPLIITENGIAARDDEKRQAYLKSHLRAVRRTLDAGYDVRGYFHWTLMDCFEWTSGYGPQFGLHTVDTQANVLVPKASAQLYRSLIAGRVMDGNTNPTMLEPATLVATNAR